MWTQLYWVDGPWPGELALAARPRGGDWLDDEMAHWRQAGVDTVLSLLTGIEQAALNLSGEADSARANGMKFLHFPIEDREVPDSERDMIRALAEVEREVAIGRNVAIHCRQGVGRTGLMAACLLVSRGIEPAEAVARISAARGVTVPETLAQRDWIDRFERTLAIVEDG